MFTSFTYPFKKFICAWLWLQRTRALNRAQTLERFISWFHRTSTLFFTQSVMNSFITLVNVNCAWQGPCCEYNDDTEPLSLFFTLSSQQDAFEGPSPAQGQTSYQPDSLERGKLGCCFPLWAKHIANCVKTLATLVPPKLLPWRRHHLTDKRPSLLHHSIPITNVGTTRYSLVSLIIIILLLIPLLAGNMKVTVASWGRRWENVEKKYGRDRNHPKQTPTKNTSLRSLLCVFSPSFFRAPFPVFIPFLQQTLLYYENTLPF